MICRVCEKYGTCLRDRLLQIDAIENDTQLKISILDPEFSVIYSSVGSDQHLSVAVEMSDEADLIEFNGALRLRSSGKIIQKIHLTTQIIPLVQECTAEIKVLHGDTYQGEERSEGEVAKPSLIERKENLFTRALKWIFRS